MLWDTSGVVVGEQGGFKGRLSVCVVFFGLWCVSEWGQGSKAYSVSLI